MEDQQDTKNVKLDPEVKAKWIAALRSGEFEQGTGVLRASNNTYCCMGVLCEVHNREHSAHDWSGRVRGTYLGEECYPPESVWGWAGVTSQEEMVELQEYLCHLNDDCGKTFSEIAEDIETRN